METTTSPQPPFWHRPWFRLMVWSALVAAGMLLWQSRQEDYLIRQLIETPSLATIGINFIFSFIFVLIPSAICFRAWRNRPTGRKAWYVLGLAAVALGISDYLLQMHLDPGNATYYSPIFFLTWLLIHAAIVVIGLLFLYSLRHFLKWLVRWRIVKRAILLALALAALITLFYTEENWRGRRAWAEYRQTWEAKGEKLDYLDFVPSPIPDAQNVAMAPLLADSFAGPWLATTNQDNKSPRTNHSRLNLELWRTNAMNLKGVKPGNWQLGKPTSLPEWQNYYRARFVTNVEFVPYMPGWPGMMPGKAVPERVVPNAASSVQIIALDTTEFPINDQPQTPATDVLLALSRYQPVLAELAQALQRPQARFPLDYAAENPQQIPYPHLGDLKKCAAVLQLRAIAELQAGQDELALTDVKMILQLADTIRPELGWISFLARLAIIDQTIQPIWQGLAARQWSAADLKELNRSLRSLDLMAEGQTQWHADRAIQIAFIEYARKHRDESAWLLIMAISPKPFENLEKFLDNLPNPPEPAQELIDMLAQILPADSIEHLVMSLPPDGWYEWNKVTLAKFYQERLFQEADVNRHWIAPQKVLAASSYIDQQRVMRNISPHDVLAYDLLPETRGLAQRIARTQNAVDMANVACGLEQFRMAHGNYPASLTSLIPDFLPSLPPDVINGEPLHYQPTPAGSFVLYSVGWNGTNDGGIVATNLAGGINPWAGDWVWQYPKP